MTTSPPAAALSGPTATVLAPGDAGYDDARRVWNGDVDRYPAWIARCRSTEDVVAAVRFAVQHDLLLAVRGGGHSLPGHSTCDGGVVVDLSPMKRIQVDAGRRVAHVEPGVLWQELDPALWQHGLATTGGEISDTGVAGLTLGGGIGWLSRTCGHACDNLVGAQLVTAGGEVLEVDDERDPELMWALRGGGGNFGVVTRFDLRAHAVPVPHVLSALWPADAAPAVLRRWRDVTATAPRELSAVCVLVSTPPVPDLPEAVRGQAVVGVTAAWFGAEAEADAALQPFLAGVPQPGLLVRDAMPYPALQQMFDAMTPAGMPAYIRSELLAPLDDAALDALVAQGTAPTSPLCQVLLRHLGGAAGDVAPGATAFAHRDARSMLTVAAMWEPGGDAERHRAWCRSTWAAVRSFSAGTYVNHLAVDEGAARVREAYPEPTRARLAAVKARLDPGNAFRLNANVVPAGSTA